MRHGAILILSLLVAGCTTSAERGPGLSVEDWRARQILGQSTPLSGQSDRRVVETVPARRGTESRLFPGGAPLGGTGRGVVNVGGGMIELDLVDTDVREAAKMVLGDIFRLSYVVDPSVAGTITLKTEGRIPARDSFALFETALQQTGATLVRQGKAYAVVPAATGSIDAAPGVEAAGDGGETRPGFTSRAVTLRHISAKEMAEILKPYAKDSLTRIDSERNVIVLTGTSAQHDAWMETVRTFDVDWLANKSVGVFKIASMSAEDMIRNVSKLLTNANIDDSMATLSVIETNNSVLVVARTRATLTSIRRWIERLDAAGGNGQQLFTYDMRFARAQDVAPVLASVFGASTATPGKVAETAAASPPDQPAAPPADPAMVNPPGMDADGGSRGRNGEMRVVADTGSNTLLIFATRDQYDKVRDVLRTIDVPQKQVLVEATIVEVTLNDDLKYGVQYFLDRMVEGTRIVGGFSTGKTVSVDPSPPGFSLALGVSTRAVIEALSGVTQVNVISSPNVMALNNETARLVVGDQVPVATQSRQKDLESDVVVNTVEFRDTGVIFDVTPRINSGGSVTLNIVQEVSGVSRQATPSLTPTISQRKVQSAVTALDGETIVLGGLFSKSSSRGVSSLPGFSRVPLLSALVGSNQIVKTKTELLILITPRIISNAQDSRLVTSEMRDRIRELRAISEDKPRARRQATSQLEPQVEPQPVSQRTAQAKPQSKPQGKAKPVKAQQPDAIESAPLRLRE